MKSVVIVSPEAEKWDAFASVLGNQCQMNVAQAHSAAEAIAVAKEKKPVAMVIDQDLGDMTGINLVPELIQINALINIALVSDQSEEDFHEVTEGLGIMMKLSPHPDAQAAVAFSERLAGVI